MTRVRIALALATAVLLLAAQPALACAVCWGSPDAPMVKGVNSGMYVLLAFVAFVQIGFIALFWSFWKRARDLKRFRDSLQVIHGGQEGSGPMYGAGPEGLNR